MAEGDNQNQGGSVIGAWADTGLMALIIVLVLWILRRQTTITDNIANSIDQQNQKIEQVDHKVQEYKDSWDIRRDGMVETFNRICHERQGACSNLVATQLTAGRDAADAKMANFNTRLDHACRKIEDLKTRRDKRWARQDQINDRLLNELKNNNRKGSNG